MEELLQQQPHRQQPQLPGAAAPNPWPPPKAPLPPQQSVAAQPLPRRVAAQPLPRLSPPEEVDGDELKDVVVAEKIVEMVGKGKAFDGGEGTVEFETSKANQEEQEEQWPSPTQQQQQEDQQQLQLQSPGPAPPAWSPAAPAEFENIYSVGLGRLRGEKRWHDGLVVKLNCESNLSSSMRASGAEPIDVWARAGIGTRWLVAMEGARNHGHPAGKAFPPFGPD